MGGGENSGFAHAESKKKGTGKDPRRKWREEIKGRGRKETKRDHEWEIRNQNKASLVSDHLGGLTCGKPRNEKKGNEEEKGTLHGGRRE